MDIELNALRRVAKAAKKYQDKVIQGRFALTAPEKELSSHGRETLEIGSAEFELSEALNEWFRLYQKSN
jgi:hypothetical protein